MDKKRVISIITKAAKSYQENLEDQKVLFVYGVPSEVKKQVEQNADVISCLEFYEVVFHRSNLLHLTDIISGHAVRWIGYVLVSNFI